MITSHIYSSKHVQFSGKQTKNDHYMHRFSSKLEHLFQCSCENLMFYLGLIWLFTSILLLEIYSMMAGQNSWSFGGSQLII